MSYYQSPLSYSYLPLVGGTPSHPADRYLDALTNVRQAEADYRRSQLLQRQEENEIRARLAAIELQKAQERHEFGVPSYLSSHRYPIHHDTSFSDAVLTRTRDLELEEQRRATQAQGLVIQRLEQELAAERQRRQQLEQDRSKSIALRAELTKDYDRLLRENKNLQSTVTQLQLQTKRTAVPQAAASSIKPVVHLQDIISSIIADRVSSTTSGDSKNASRPSGVSACKCTPESSCDVKKPAFHVRFDMRPQPAQAAPASQAASSAKTSAPVPATKAQVTASPSKEAPKAPSTHSHSAATDGRSLKELLESRLYSDPQFEVQDTIRAILSSLGDEVLAFKSTARQDTPSQPTAGPSSSKGKEKEPSPSRPQSPAIDSVDVALAVVESIDSAFTSLESGFVFPSQVDFVPINDSDEGSRPASPASNASASSAIARLSFTARNQPIKFYEKSLTDLLTRLDAVESFGDEHLRLARKEVVIRIEKALEELEREVESRWIAIVIKEKSADAALQTAEAQVAEPSTASAAANVAVPLASETVDAHSKEGLPVYEDSEVLANEVTASVDLDVTPRPLTPSGSEEAQVTEVKPYLIEEPDSEAEGVEESVSDDDSAVSADVNVYNDKVNKESAKEDAASDWSEVEA